MFGAPKSSWSTGSSRGQQLAAAASALMPRQAATGSSSMSKQARATPAPSASPAPQNGKQLRRPLAVGLGNLGNTCFMNSSLQALGHLVPFFDWCVAHLQQCSRGKDKCYSCLLASNVRAAFTTFDRPSVDPHGLANNLRHVNGRFRLGLQEDAQEYIVGLLDVLERSVELANKAAPGEPPLPVCGAFRGQLLSRVQCARGGHTSDKVDPFETLSVEIAGVTNVTDALKGFTASEPLRGANQYRCEGCGNQLVDAAKFLRIQVPPPCLALQLKRFAFRGFFTAKDGRHIAFGRLLRLDGHAALAASQEAGLRELQRAYDDADTYPYLDGKGQPIRAFTQDDASGAMRPYLQYSLRCVLVHAGGSPQSGHYFSYVRPHPHGPGLAPSVTTHGYGHGASSVDVRADDPQRWFLMNDSSVSPAAWNTVAGENAYILFYAPADGTPAADVIRVLTDTAPPLPPPDAAQPKAGKATSGGRGRSDSSTSVPPAASSSSSSSSSAAAARGVMIGPQLPPVSGHSSSSSAAVAPLPKPAAPAIMVPRKVIQQAAAPSTGLGGLSASGLPLAVVQASAANSAAAATQPRTTGIAPAPSGGGAVGLPAPMQLTYMPPPPTGGVLPAPPPTGAKKGLTGWLAPMLCGTAAAAAVELPGQPPQPLPAPAPSVTSTAAAAAGPAGGSSGSQAAVMTVGAKRPRDEEGVDQTRDNSAKATPGGGAGGVSNSASGNRTSSSLAGSGDGVGAAEGTAGQPPRAKQSRFSDAASAAALPASVASSAPLAGVSAAAGPALAADANRTGTMALAAAPPVRFPRSEPDEEGTVVFRRDSHPPRVSAPATAVAPVPAPCANVEPTPVSGGATGAMQATVTGGLEPVRPIASAVQGGAPREAHSGGEVTAGSSVPSPAQSALGGSAAGGTLSYPPVRAVAGGGSVKDEADDREAVERVARGRDLLSVAAFLPVRPAPTRPAQGLTVPPAAVLGVALSTPEPAAPPAASALPLSAPAGGAKPSVAAAAPLVEYGSEDEL